jgi:hypothetical protein
MQCEVQLNLFQREKWPHFEGGGGGVQQIPVNSGGEEKKNGK